MNEEEEKKERKKRDREREKETTDNLFYGQVHCVTTPA
jgi:hypothetical protein